jgi:hypothetical protein
MRFSDPIPVTKKAPLTLASPLRGERELKERKAEDSRRSPLPGLWKGEGIEGMQDAPVPRCALLTERRLGGVSEISDNVGIRGVRSGRIKTGVALVH